MRDSYIALGVTPSGNALVMRPIIPGGSDGFAHHFAPCDMQALGFGRVVERFGEMMISSLGAFQPEVKRFSLLLNATTSTLPPAPSRRLSDGSPKPIATVEAESELWMQAMLAEVLRAKDKPEAAVPFPTNPPLIHPRGEMRDLRLGLGVVWNVNGAGLRVRTYSCEEPIGEVYSESLQHLAALSRGIAQSIIGEIMLRKLAMMHPDVFALAFPDAEFQIPPVIDGTRE